MSVAALKTPPWNAEAEDMVIGAIGVFPDAFDRASVLLAPEDFYSNLNYQAWKYAAQVHAAGQPVDATVLVDLARRDGRDDVAERIIDAATAVPSAANLEAHAQSVLDARLERDLIVAGTQIADVGFSADLSVAEKVNRAQQIMFSVGQARQHEAMRPMRAVLRSVVEDIEQRWQNHGQIQGLSTGFVDVDQRWQGMRSGDLIVIAGRPAMGKTTLAMNIAEHNAAMGKRVLVFSLEMTAEQIIERSIAGRGGIRFDDIRTGNVMASQSAYFLRAVTDLRELDVVIDDSGSTDLPRIRSRARLHAITRPLDLIVIDYLQLVEGQGNSANDRVAQISRGLKQLAKEMRCPVILLSQLNREVDRRPYPRNRPVLADLRDSGAIEQDADLVAFVYRNSVYRADCKYSEVAELITAKFRNGRPGTNYLRADFDHCRFQSYGGTKPEYDTGVIEDAGFSFGN